VGQCSLGEKSASYGLGYMVKIKFFIMSWLMLPHHAISDFCKFKNAKEKI
jgi:hypothetical protein